MSTRISVDTITQASNTGLGPIIPGQVLYTTFRENATRTTVAAAANGTVGTTTFNKMYGASDSYIIIKGIVPAGNNVNGGSYFKAYVDGETSFASTYGLMDQETGQNYSNGLAIHQAYYGMGTGLHTYTYGWEVRDGTSNAPSTVYNPNSSDDARNRQTGTVFIIYEVGINDPNSI